MSITHTIARLLWNQQWLPLRAKKTIYKKLCQYEPAPDAAFTRDFFGLTYHGNLNNNIEFNIYYYDAFEKPLLFFLRDTLKAIAPRDDSVFFDVGANIGQHSLFMSQIASQVHAFEPYAPVRSRLQYHIDLNHIANIQVHEVGLSEHSEALPFFAPTGRNQGIGSFDASTVSKGNKPIGELQLVCGDDYVANEKLATPALVKIDVEGFEKPALTGLRDTLRSARPVVVTEITYGKPLSFQSVEEFKALLPDDYELYAFNTRKADGSKARRRGAKAKRTGHYELLPYTRWLDAGQDDVVACPAEKVDLLPGIRR